MISCYVVVSALRSVRESEELVVNAAATINNLSFYQAEGSALGRSRLTVAKRKTGRLSLCRIRLCICVSPLIPPLLILSNASDDEAAAQRQYGRCA